MTLTHTLKKHRHALAAPIAMAALIASCLTPARSITEAQELSGKDRSQSSSAIVQILEGSHTPPFQEGTALVSGADAYSFQAGDALLQGFQGGFYVTRTHQKLTVVALTTPVLVHVGSQMTIVPLGRQWQSQDGTLPSLRDGWESWMAARQTQSIPSEFLARVLPQLTAVLPSASPTRPDCLGQAQDLSVNPDFWLLLQFHPLCRAAGWLQVAPIALSREALALRVLLFPQADLLSRGAEESVQRRYALAIPAFLAQEGNVDDFLPVLFTTLTQAIQDHHAAHHPLREAAYSDLLQSLQSRYVPAPRGQVGASSSSVSSDKPEDAAAHTGATPSCSAVLPHDAALAAAEELLKTVHALMTVYTMLTPQNDGSVDVRAVGIPGDSGDHLYSFTLWPHCQRVEDITKDGVAYPYPIDQAQFEVWVGE